MIAFRYTKTEGAEFISHLDTLRHLNKIFLRAEIEVRQSQGFHPHPLVYMASPIPLGLKSLAEYCTVDADVPADIFIERFNAFSPKGIKCTMARNVDKNPNFAAIIDRAEYFIGGVGEMSISDLGESFTVMTKNGEREVRDKIYSLRPAEGGVVAVLAAGNAALRVDAFAKKLLLISGGERADIVKKESFAGQVPACEIF